MLLTMLLTSCALSFEPVRLFDIIQILTFGKSFVSVAFAGEGVTKFVTIKNAISITSAARACSMQFDQ